MKLNTQANKSAECKDLVSRLAIIVTIVLEQAKTYLGAVKDQLAETDKYTQDSCEGQARFGVIKRQRDNDMELHTDQQMYSCGSLAPKMGRGGGCSNHKFNRPSQPWEKADGCVYLLGELSSIPEASKEVLKLLPLLANACQYQHYPQHVVLLETVCKQLPSLAKHLGVRAFKAYLDLFLDPVFRSIERQFKEKTFINKHISKSIIVFTQKNVDFLPQLKQS
ncbi:hypothetical protein J6590_057997 [Homalodisca vitripennis]|nr:hypothetical protein J6590_057997 [Homalodisca vitripennis]